LCRTASLIKKEARVRHDEGQGRKRERKPKKELDGTVTRSQPESQTETVECGEVNGDWRGEPEVLEVP
jgi:hypothetical protein